MNGSFDLAELTPHVHAIGIRIFLVNNQWSTVGNSFRNMEYLVVVILFDQCRN